MILKHVETKGTDVLKGVDGILVPGGFGYRGVEGKILTAKYARENNVPYLGICLGMQIALIEYARNVAGLEKANSSEFDRHCEQPVVGLINRYGKTRKATLKPVTTIQISVVRCV